MWFDAWKHLALDHPDTGILEQLRKIADKQARESIDRLKKHINQTIAAKVKELEDEYKPGMEEKSPL